MPDDDPRATHELTALAWEAYVRNHLAEAARLASRASIAAATRSRRERQEVQVVCLALGGDGTRAHDLAAQHLAEFPDDELVVRVLRATTPQPEP